MVLKNKIAYWNKKVRGINFCDINDNYWFCAFLKTEEIKAAIDRIEFLKKRDKKLINATRERNIILEIFKNIYDYE